MLGVINSVRFVLYLWGSDHLVRQFFMVSGIGNTSIPNQAWIEDMWNGNMSPVRLWVPDGGPDQVTRLLTLPVVVLA